MSWGHAVRGALSRVGTGISIYSAVVFAVFWIGFGYSVAVGSNLPSASWDWLIGLPPVAGVAAWVALLPASVSLWVLQADWPLWLRGVALGGLVVWTLSALWGVVTAFYSEPRRA